MAEINNKQEKEKTYILGEGGEFKNQESQEGFIEQETPKEPVESVANITTIEPIKEETLETPENVLWIPVGQTKDTTEIFTPQVEEFKEWPSPVIRDDKWNLSTWISPLKDTTLKSLDDINLWEVVKESFIRGSEVGLSKWEVLENIRKRLSDRNFDVSDLDNKISGFTEEFSSLNLSSDDFLKGLMNWETYWKFYENNSVDYQQAKEIFNSFNSIQKTETGIKTAVKNWEISKWVMNELIKNPQWQQWINEVNTDIVKQEALKWTAADILSLSNEDKVSYIKAIMEKFGLNESYEERITWDDVLNKNRENYANINSKLSEVYSKRSTLLEDIRERNPRASEQEIYNIYRRQNEDINEEIKALSAEGALYKTNYDLRLSEVTKGIDYDNKQAEKQFSTFKELFNAQWGEQRAEAERLRQDEQIKINNEKIVKWSYSESGDLTWIDAFWNVVTTLEWYNSWASTSSSDGLSNISTKYWDDGSSTTTYYNKETQQIVQKHFNKNEEPLIVTDWVNKAWEITWYGWDYDKNTGLDIKAEWKSSFTSPFNWKVLDYIPNNWAYGNSLVVEDEEWNVIQYNHLDSTTLKPWDEVGAWTVLWKVGNTGNVRTKWANGEWRAVTEDERNQWRGAHLDIVSRPAGTTNRTLENARSSRDTEVFLNGQSTTDIPVIKGTVRDLLRNFSKTALSGALAKSVFGSRPSDEESARADAIIEENIDKSYSELKEQLAWYVILWWDEELANNLKNTLRSRIGDLQVAWPVLSTMSDFINNWNNGQAIRTMETAIIEDIPKEQLINESTVAFTRDRVNELLKFIWEAEKNPAIWPIEWQFDKWLGRFQEAWASQIQTRITELVAEMRNRLSGTTVTESESSFLEPLIPDLVDGKDKFLFKIERLKDVPLQELNTLRESVWLPKINESMAGQLNYSDRVKLYKWEDNRKEQLRNELKQSTSWWFKTKY